MSLPRYVEYKDSGVMWLERIPRHWNVVRLKFLAAKKKFAIVDGPFGTQLKADDYRPYGIPVVRISNLSYEGKFINDDLVFIDKGKAVDLDRSKVERYDVIVGKTGATIGKSAVFPLDAGIIASSCIKISTDFRVLSPQFLAKCLLAPGFLEMLINASGGSTRDTINIEPFGNLSVAVPTIAEQYAITAFLDRETAKIDALIAEQEKLITLLTEKRQAIISHVVTRGIHRDVPMKDSGVAWMREVPVHWTVAKLGHFATVENGTTPSRAVDEFWKEGDIPWLASGEVNQLQITEASEFITKSALEKCSLRMLPVGTVVVGMIGQGKTRGMSAMLCIPATINQNLAAICPGKHIESAYLLYLLHAVYEWLREAGRGGNQAAMNCEILSSLRIPVPPIQEQKDIISFIEIEAVKLDILKVEAERAITVLKERRSALIAAAVTGQIDVRGTVDDLNELMEAATA